MKAKRKKPAQPKPKLANLPRSIGVSDKLDKKKVRAELYNPDNIEKARRLERGPIV